LRSDPPGSAFAGSVPRDKRFEEHDQEADRSPDHHPDLDRVANVGRDGVRAIRDDQRVELVCVPVCSVEPVLGKRSDGA
jgi:hypothetical protein